MGNFAWRKACTVLKVKQQEVVDAGWPLTLSATVLSWLQFTERADRRDLERELLSECTKGAIPFIEVKQVHRSIQITRRPITFSSIDWRGYPTEGTLVQTAVAKEVMVRQLAPADFKGWLAAQNLAPSEHIAAWFDAMGVADAPLAAPLAVVSIPPQTTATIVKKSKNRDLMTPRIEDAQRNMSDPFDAPAIWSKLCTMAENKVRPLFGISDTGIQWKDGNDDPQELTLKMLRDRLGRQKRATQKTIKAPLVRVK